MALFTNLKYPAAKNAIKHIREEKNKYKSFLPNRSQSQGVNRVGKKFMTPISALQVKGSKVSWPKFESIVFE